MGQYTRPAIGIGSSLLGSWIGSKATQSAMQRTPEEQRALAGGQREAGFLAKQGTMLTQAGMPAVTGATDYYTALLRGNRAQMGLATAAPRAALTEQYRGAERGLERSGVRGATKELARAELSRDRASRVAGLTTGVQPMAAQALGGLGTTLTGQGTAAHYGAGANYAGLLRAGTENRVYGREQGQQAGSAWGSTIFDLLMGGAGGGSSGGSWWQNLLGGGGPGGGGPGGGPGGMGSPSGPQGSNPFGDIGFAGGSTGYFDANGNWIPTWSDPGGTGPILPPGETTPGGRYGGDPTAGRNPR